MLKFKISLVVGYFLICFNFVLGQTTIVRGRIIDATSFEPVGFANVYFQNTTVGTISDFDGYFELKGEGIFDTICVSFVGYLTSKKPVIHGVEQVINFQLTPSMIHLKEVVIVPGENPAIAFMKKVFQSKHQFNIERLQAYEYISYTKSQVYFRRLFNREAAKDTVSTGIFDRFSVNADEQSMPALPAYMSETFAEVYYRKTPESSKSIIRAVNTASLAEVETALLTQLTQKATFYNFYNNNINILDKNFISPLSQSGLFYYKYIFTDSMYIDGVYCYELLVLPKRKEDLVFTGRIWIVKSSYALKRISVETMKEANLNFVDRIKIQQEYEEDISGVWFPKSTRILADAINIFISASIVNSDFRATEPRKNSFYDTELFIADSAYMVTSSTWESLRPMPLDEIDKTTMAYIDSLKNYGKMRLLTALVNMSVKGYVSLGKIELGPYLLLYKYNDVEGNRFRLGYRTSSLLSTKWFSKGFLAYGTKDHRIKYNFQIEYFFSRKSWTKAGFQYSEDAENLGAADEFLTNSAFLSFTSSIGGADKLNFSRTGRLWFETDVFRGFSQKIVLKHKFLSPLSPDYVFEFYTDAERTVTTSDIRVTEISLISIYQPKATYIVDKNERFSVAIKKAPVFTLQYTIGVKDLFQSQLNYHVLSMRVKQGMHFGGLGFFQYDFQVEKHFSQLPYPLLTMFPANESFFRFDRTFNLMSYGEFVADQSAELFVSYRQEGFITDKIPLLKKLRLRTVATLSIAYGSFNHARNGFYDPEANPTGILPPYSISGVQLTGFKTLEPSKPYIEVSYGIENIFSIFRIDAIHRLSYLQPDQDGDLPPKFGLKIGAAFRF